MALMLSRVYDAFIASGAPQDKAQAASEEIAGYDARLASVDTRLPVLTWMVGAVIAITSAILFMLVRAH